MFGLNRNILTDYPKKFLFFIIQNEMVKSNLLEVLSLWQTFVYKLQQYIILFSLIFCMPEISIATTSLLQKICSNIWIVGILKVILNRATPGACWDGSGGPMVGDVPRLALVGK